MEEGLGWEHGVQFVCLAFQNSSAHLIDGYTIHSWAQIDMCHSNASHAAKPRRNVDELKARFQALRVVIIDEIGMVSAKLLGQLEHRLEQMMSERDTYKIRGGMHQDAKTLRKFGGVNLIMLGDFWQIPPIGGTELTSNIALADPGCEQNAMQIWWGEGEDSIHHLWELVSPMRCDDVWYNKVLDECRRGALNYENYAYLHGLPTYTSPSAACTCNAHVINDPILGPVRSDWQQYFLQGGDMEALQANTTSECMTCRTERHDRQRVVTNLEHMRAEFQQPPFESAPTLYSYNEPRYFCTFLRAKGFAKQRNVELSWCLAVDQPSQEEIDTCTPQGLDQKRIRWLQRHDQKTNHFPSIYALAVGMPVKLTIKVDAERKLYKDTKGIIHGWTLDAACEHEEIPGEGEYLLSHLPEVVYIKFPHAKWKIGTLPTGVYPLKRRSTVWDVDTYKGLKVRRIGFPFLPDFTSTAFKCQGQTLGAAFADLQSYLESGSLKEQIEGYICMSRVKRRSTMCIVQAFSPYLFTHGNPKGAERLLRKMRGELTAAGAQAE